MSDEAELDMNDPHEAHAVFAMEFQCEACGRELPFNSGEARLSNAWFRELASLARKNNWFAPPTDADGKMDVMRAWCPECANRLRSVAGGILLDETKRPPSDYERL